MDIADPSQASSYSIGQQFAGFGNIGLTPAHALWLALLIARGGQSKALTLLRQKREKPFQEQRIFSEHTAFDMQKAMSETVRLGTATQVFRKRRYRFLRRVVGGKTGTLMGKNPEGLTSWFIGLMPFHNPKIVVSAVVVNHKKKWVIKGTHLAAEAFKLWKKICLIVIFKSLF